MGKMDYFYLIDLFYSYVIICDKLSFYTGDPISNDEYLELISEKRNIEKDIILGLTDVLIL